MLLFPVALSDPVVASLAQDIFKELAQIEGCQGPMQMRLIPTLISIMQAPHDKIPTGLCAVSGFNSLLKLTDYFSARLGIFISYLHFFL